MRKSLLVLFAILVIVSCAREKHIESTKQFSLTDSLSEELNDEEELSKMGIVESNGIQILQKSRNAYYVQELAGLYLSSVTLTNCLNNGSEPNRNDHHQISEIIDTDSTFSIEFCVFETCGSDFICDVGLTNESSLNLVYLQHHSLADCRCCYGIKFNFYKLDDPLGYYNIEYITFNGVDKVKLSQVIKK